MVACEDAQPSDKHPLGMLVLDGPAAPTLAQFWKLWSHLIPAEQARVVRLLVEKVLVKADGIDITLHIAGLGQISREMLGKGLQRSAA